MEVRFNRFYYLLNGKYVLYKYDILVILLLVFGGIESVLQDTRLVYLYDRLNLEKQIVSSVSDAEAKEAIESELDYVYINERLKEMKEESIRFVRSNLLPCLVYRNEDFD